MPETIDSFLEHRRAELLADNETVPIDYDELRERAREELAQGTYDYVAGGAGSENTVRANREAFNQYRIVNKVLQDVSERDLGTELFGREITAPLMLAPIGGQEKYDEEGELAPARAAGNLGLPIALSTTASRSIEAFAEANGDGPRFFQLYWPNDWDVAASLIQRADRADYDGIVLTVDSQLSKWRQRNLRNAYRGGREAPKAIFESDPVVQNRAEAAGRPLREYVFESSDLDDNASLGWDDLDALREWTDLPVVLKGILTAEDARKAVEWGAEGIVVSNHGGRQIDGEAATLHQLPGIVEAVGDETTIIVDSGVRNGADIFKALALGADVVQFGRPYIFGLSINGQQGVREVVMNNLAELESIMGLSGRPSIDRIDQRALVFRTMHSDSPRGVAEATRTGQDSRIDR